MRPDTVPRVTFGLAVADVGAGYTTLLAGRTTAAVIDFGAPSERASMAGLDRLMWSKPHARHRDWVFPSRWFRQFGSANDILISHPHRDHYNGLLGYAKRRARGEDS